MTKKLLLLAVGLGLSLAASSGARPGPLYIICGTCTVNDPTVPCVCEDNSRHPGRISNCSTRTNDCWDGVPPYFEW